MQPTGIQPSQLLMEVMASAKDKIGQSIGRSEFSQQLHEQHRLVQNIPLGSSATAMFQQVNPSSSSSPVSEQSASGKPSGTGPQSPAAEVTTSGAVKGSALASSLTKNLVVSKWKSSQALKFTDSVALEKVLAQYHLAPSITASVREALDQQGQISVQKLNQVLDRASAGSSEVLPEGRAGAADIQALLAAVQQQNQPVQNLKDLPIRGKDAYDFGEFRELLRRVVDQVARASLKLSRKSALPQTPETDSATADSDVAYVSPARAKLPNQTQSLTANLIPSFLRDEKRLSNEDPNSLPATAEAVADDKTAGTETMAAAARNDREDLLISEPSDNQNRGAASRVMPGESKSPASWFWGTLEYPHALQELISGIVPRAPSKGALAQVYPPEPAMTGGSKAITGSDNGLARQVPAEPEAAAIARQDVVPSAMSTEANTSSVGAAVLWGMRSVTTEADFGFQANSVARTMSAWSSLPVVEKIAASAMPRFFSADRDASESRNFTSDNHSVSAQQETPGTVKPLFTIHQPDGSTAYPQDTAENPAALRMAPAATAARESGTRSSAAGSPNGIQARALFSDVTHMQMTTSVPGNTNNTTAFNAEILKSQITAETPTAHSRPLDAAAPDQAATTVPMAESAAAKTSTVIPAGPSRPLNAPALNRTSTAQPMAQTAEVPFPAATPTAPRRPLDAAAPDQAATTVPMGEPVATKASTVIPALPGRPLNAPAFNRTGTAQPMAQTAEVPFPAATPTAPSRPLDAAAPDQAATTAPMGEPVAAKASTVIPAAPSRPLNAPALNRTGTAQPMAEAAEVQTSPATPTAPSRPLDAAAPDQAATTAPMAEPVAAKASTVIPAAPSRPLNAPALNRTSTAQPMAEAAEVQTSPATPTAPSRPLDAAVPDQAATTAPMGEPVAAKASTVIPAAPSRSLNAPALDRIGDDPEMPRTITTDQPEKPAESIPTSGPQGKDGYSLPSAHSASLSSRTTIAPSSTPHTAPTERVSPDAFRDSSRAASASLNESAPQPDAAAPTLTFAEDAPMAGPGVTALNLGKSRARPLPTAQAHHDHSGNALESLRTDPQAAGGREGLVANNDGDLSFANTTRFEAPRAAAFAGPGLNLAGLAEQSGKGQPKPQMAPNPHSSSLQQEPVSGFEPLEGQDVTPRSPVADTASPQATSITSEDWIPAGTAQPKPASQQVGAELSAKMVRPFIFNESRTAPTPVSQEAFPEATPAGIQNNVELSAERFGDNAAGVTKNTPVAPEAGERTARHTPLDSKPNEIAAAVKGEKAVPTPETAEQGLSQEQSKEHTPSWFRDDLQTVTIRATSSGATPANSFSGYASSLTTELAQRIRELHNQKRHELTLELEPEHLGRLRVRIGTDDHQVTAMIATESEQVKDLLSKSSAALRQELAAQGLVLEKLQIDVNSQSTSQEQFFHKQGSSFRRNGSQQQATAADKGFADPGARRTPIGDANTLISLFV